MAATGRLTVSQEAVVAAIEGFTLPEGPIVIALSGGADSAALAWAVSRLRRDVRAVSVHHGLPGSARLMEAAAAIAGRLGIHHTVIEVESDDTTETALRAVRLEALEAGLSGDETIITGHTADDQAETVLGNLVRGAGTSGLSGIPGHRDPYHRPLLAVPGDTVRSAAADAELPFVDDPENTDPGIRRNRLRHVTIPHLAEEYNPAVIEALVRAGRLAAADDRLIEERASTIPVRMNEEAVVIPAAALTTLPAPVASRVIRRALRLLAGPYGGSTGDVDTVLGVAARGTTASLAGRLVAAKERGSVAIYPAGGAAPPAPSPLDPDQPTRFGPWVIAPAAERPRLGCWGALLDAGSVVRAARPGDRIGLSGGGHKRVVDVLSEARVPVRLRSRWPVVTADDTIVWIVGLRTAPGTRSGRWYVAVREGA